MSTLDFLMSRGMQRVLAPVLLHPDQSYSLSDLIRIAGAGRGGTQKVVETLRTAGVLNDWKVGNQRHFAVNTAHPFYPELRSLGMKSFGLADCLRKAFSSMASQIETAFVFGSIAANTAHSESDIDLLVVGDVDFFQISATLSEVERDLSRPIHLNLVGSDEWPKWRITPIGESIMKSPKIMVVGDEC